MHLFLWDGNFLILHMGNRGLERLNDLSQESHINWSQTRNWIPGFFVPNAFPLLTPCYEGSSELSRQHKPLLKNGLPYGQILFNLAQRHAPWEWDGRKGTTLGPDLELQAWWSVRGWCWSPCHLLGDLATPLHHSPDGLMNLLWLPLLRLPLSLLFLLSCLIFLRVYLNTWFLPWGFSGLKRNLLPHW